MLVRVIDRSPDLSNSSHAKRSCGTSFLFPGGVLSDLDLSRQGGVGAWCQLQAMNDVGCAGATTNVLFYIATSGPMPQRPGAFAAQFAPETLQRFKDLCRQQDKAYSKVLERLAVLYVETDGGILATTGSASAPSKGVQKRQVQVESLQNKLLEDLLKRVEILEKKETKTLYELDRVHKELAFLKSGLQAPEL